MTPFCLWARGCVLMRAGRSQAITLENNSLTQFPRGSLFSQARVAEGQTFFISVGLNQVSLENSSLAGLGLASV